ncbi:MAG: MCE family protein [Myxococcales bacterium]|nr:MCE family protein [Myxococcales bacterium]
MSEGGARGAGPPELPVAEVRRHRSLPVVWIIPLVAAVIGALLVYRTVYERGPMVEITFKTAEGITPGKTTVSYLAVQIGSVEDVDVAEDGRHVIVSARILPSEKHGLVEGARFWVVRPRVGPGGISGLGTLVSGAYIGFDPGASGAKSARKFKGLPRPPLDLDEDDSLRIELESQTLSGVGDGSPIFYRAVEVGHTDQYELAEEGKEVVIYASIRPEYASLVRTNSRFYKAGGFRASASLAKGLDVQLESVRSLLVGGVAFETPGSWGKPVKDDARFKLYPSRKQAELAEAERSGLHVVVESPMLGGLSDGDPVLYRETRVGDVISFAVHPDGRSVGIRIRIDKPYSALVRTDTRFWNASGVTADLGLTGLHVHTESLSALLAGGIAFATPDKPGRPAAAGSVFELYDKPEKQWLRWSPRIWIGPGKDPGAGTGAGPGSATKRRARAKQKPEKVHFKQDAGKDPKSHHWFQKLFHRGSD